MKNVIENLYYASNIYARYNFTMKVQHDFNLLKRVQCEKLKWLINFAYNKTKYYRELFDNIGLSPDDINEPEDLQSIPILTKDDLRSRFWDFLPSSLKSVRVSRTSGSTGVPLCLLTDERSKIYNSLAVMRYRKLLGIPPVGRKILTLAKTPDGRSKKQYMTWLQGIHKTYYINPYVMTEENIAFINHTLLKLRGVSVIAITPAIKQLCSLIKDKLIRPFYPNAVLSTGQYIDDYLRKFIEHNLSCKVSDIYACNEAGDVAFQCRHNSYHINADNCIIEITKNGNTVLDDSSGNVTLTNLNRYCMPIIRYLNGDVGELKKEQCSCGCSLPVLKKIHGRAGDDIKLANGKKISWHIIKSTLTHPFVRQFQIIQNTDYSLEIKYVCEKNANLVEIQKNIENRLNKIIPKNILINFAVVDKIPPQPSGKTKLVISRIKQL